jgi:hypothetical protein
MRIKAGLALGLLAVALGSVLVITAFTAIPGHIGISRRVAEILQSELA